jgi:hypothetical protein
MSNDQFTEYSNQSWLGRIGGAIKGVFFGLLLFALAVPLLFWNEGRAVHTFQMLKEGAGAVVSVAADKVDPANEGKLVHVSARAVTTETLADDAFGVSANALILKRDAEMYQWKESSHRETHKKLGGGEETKTTYTYEKTWASHRIDSSDFKHPAGHENPAEMKTPAQSFVAKAAQLGAFALPSDMVRELRNFSALQINGGVEKSRSGATPHAGGFYLGNDPANPQVGDIRVKYSVVPSGDASVVAQQAGNSFGAYNTKAGGQIQLVRDGLMTAAAMFKAEQDANTMITWLIRLGGFILMFIGLAMFFRPLAVVADVVPLIGSIVGAGTGFIAFFGALASALLTIAVAWIFYRPLLAIALIAGTIALIVLIRSRSSSRKALRTSAGPTNP